MIVMSSRGKNKKRSRRQSKDGDSSVDSSPNISIGTSSSKTSTPNLARRKSKAIIQSRNTCCGHIDSFLQSLNSKDGNLHPYFEYDKSIPASYFHNHNDDEEDNK